MAESFTQRTGLAPPCGPQTCDNIAEAKSQQPSICMIQEERLLQVGRGEELGPLVESCEEELEPRRKAILRYLLGENTQRVRYK